MTAAGLDVLVVGGGMAALCAAITARRLGASVRLIEAAPIDLRGGNARHARNFRIAHEAPTAFVPGRYSEQAFADHITEVTHGAADPMLTRLLVRKSTELADWLLDKGVRLERMTRRAQPSTRTAFLFGGGKAMVNSLYATAQSRGVTIDYEHDLIDLATDADGCHATIAHGSAVEHIAAKTIIVCSGGNQADLAWLRQERGDTARGLVVRGTPFATGTVLRRLLAQGMKPVGDSTRCHIVAVDARGPVCDGGIVTRIAAIPHGIVVDRSARRFADEADDLGKTHYARWGERIAACPDQKAWLIMDADGLAQCGPTAYAPIRADDIASLAAQLGLDPGALDDTVHRYNAATLNEAGKAPRLRATHGLQPPKSHEALPLITPPFAAYPLRPGLTFAYLGLAVTSETRVLRADGTPAPRLFAAGTIMAANVLPDGYLAGLGLTIAGVFGRIAGEAAAREALGLSSSPATQPDADRRDLQVAMP